MRRTSTVALVLLAAVGSTASAVTADSGAVASAAPASARESVFGDFDGDGSADRGVFRSGVWSVEGQPPTSLGLDSDIPVPADYDGDGATDPAVFRNGTWFIGTPGGRTEELGTGSDIPVPADFDGDGAAEPAVWRPSAGAWFVLGQPTRYLGLHSDVPLPGDYDGDGAAEPAVWRPSTGAWYTEAGDVGHLGLATDIPVPMDYTGDGVTDRAVWRPATGGWFVSGEPTRWIGLAGDLPVPADYDGDGSAETTIWRPPSGAWFGPTGVRLLGQEGDQPLTIARAAATGHRPTPPAEPEISDPPASLGLPVEPHEGGDGIPSDYWAQFPLAKAAGWDDPSFFPFASFYVPYYDADEYASYGINVAMNVEFSGADIGKVTQHMWVLAGDEWVDNASANSDPKVVGWHSTDEPEMFLPEPAWETYKAQIDSLRSKNDGRFVQTNFGNGVLDSFWPDSSQKPFEQWVEYNDVSSVDKYAYTSPHVYDYLFPDLADRWPEGAHAQSSAAYYWQAQEVGGYFQNPTWARPVWVFVEVARPYLTEQGSTVITPERMEGAVWGAIIGGARGIAWFDHSNDPTCGGRAFRDCPTQRDAAVAIMRKVESLAPVINQPTLVWDFQAGQINTLAKEYNGYLYIFAQPSFFPELGTATFTLPHGVNGTEVEVLGENHIVPVQDGEFSDEFQAEYTHHVYRVSIS